MRSIVATALFLVAPFYTLAAQAPTGWQMRIDRSTNSADPDDVPDVKFSVSENGFRVTTGPAVTLWHPANVASGSYTLRGTFTLLKPSGHVNTYGLIFGGSELGGPQQSYIYFLIGQNGTYIVRHREGDAVHDIKPRTEHPAVKRPGADGRSINTLEVKVLPDSIVFLVNGTAVHSVPRSGMTARTDGIWGIRVNHLLDVEIAGLLLERNG
jgi:hypothetical protein